MFFRNADGKAVKKHTEGNNRKYAWKVQSQWQIQTEKLEISGHEIEHEMVAHCSVRKVRVLCGKIFTQRKRAYYRKVRSKIAERRVSRMKHIAA